MKRYAPLLLVMVIGCASVPPPPPVDPAMVALAAERGLDRDALERGRDLYLKRCIGCHGHVRAGGRDPLHWQGIMDRMAPLSGLDENQRQDLESYLEMADVREAAGR